MCAEESLGLGLTEDDGDEESDLPDFLLPDDSSKTRKPLPYFRTGTAPKIYKASLKDDHGLDGVSLLGEQKLRRNRFFRLKQNRFRSLPLDVRPIYFRNFPLCV